MIFQPLILGIGSILAQFILFRELQVSFQGNELSLSLILFCWLLGGGLGGLLAHRLKPRKLSFQTISFLFLASGLFCALSLFFCRGLKHYLGLSPFEILQPLQILLISGLTILPLTLVLGMSFILICRITNNPVKTYSLEAAGAFLAGLLSVILIKYLDNGQIMVIVSLLFLIGGLLSVGTEQRSVPTRTAIILLTLAAIMFGYKSLPLRFSPHKLLKSADSIYTNIAITQSDSQFNLYENGRLSFTSEDTEAIEEFAHFILLSHPRPEDVLLIGSGVSGVLAEIFKHPVKSLSYLEPDRKLIETVRKHIPQSASYGLADPRLKIYHQDARDFLNRDGSRYDIIILNLGDPSSLQLNRFYTVEFFHTVRSRLNPQGLFCLAFSSKEDILAAQMLRYNSCLYKSAKSVFKNIELIPGERMILVCSQDEAFRITPDELASRFSQRNISTRYLLPQHFRIKLLRQGYIRERLETISDSIQLNRDYLPYGFFYYLGLWGKQSWLNFGLLWQTFSGIKFGVWCVFLLAFTSLFRKHAFQMSVFTSGALGIALETLISLIFQIHFGFLYYRLGIIVASFMLGLSLGSLTMSFPGLTGESIFYGFPACRQAGRFRGNDIGIISQQFWRNPIFFLEILLGLSALALGFVLGRNQLVYFLFSGLIGLIIGMEFGIFYSRLKPHKVYLLDLSGACWGSLWTGLIFIPVLGVYQTCLLLALLKFLPLAFLKRPTR